MEKTSPNKITLLIVLVAFIGASLSTGTAHAQKIGFVNISLIMQNAPQAKEAKEKLESEFSDKDQELTRLEDQVTKLERQPHPNLSLIHI